MAIRATCHCGRVIHAKEELAGKTVKCPQCGSKVPIPVDDRQAAPSQQSSDSGNNPVESQNISEPPPSDLTSAAKRRLLSAWRLAVTALPFYWSQRSALRICFGELIEPLRSPDNDQRVIRILESNLENVARRAPRGWEIELPACCVACGEPTDALPQREQHESHDLTWPCCVPPSVVGLGAIISLFALNFWYFLLSLLAAPVLGAMCRRAATMHVLVSRCPRHADRQDLPQMFSFGQTLMIRTGSQEVVAAFHARERLSERKPAATAKAASRTSISTSGGELPAAVSLESSESRPSLATLHRSADSFRASSAEEMQHTASRSAGGFELEPPPEVPPAPAEPRICRACGSKLLPQESSCRRCQTRQGAAAPRPKAQRAEMPDAAPQEEPLTILAAIGKLVVSVTELALLVTLLSALGAGAMFFAPRFGFDPAPYLLVLTNLGVDPLVIGAVAMNALGMMLYYGATGLVVRNSVVAVLIAVGLAWWLGWPRQLWEYGAMGAAIGLLTGVLQGMFESRLAEPLAVLLAPGTGMLPGAPSRGGLVGLAKGVLAGGLCGFLLGATAGYPVYLFATANGWDIGGRGAVDYTLVAAGITGAAMAYLAGQFSMTKAERIGPWRGMYLGAALWAFCSLVCATGVVASILFSGQNGRSPQQLITLALILVAGATLSGGLIGMISGALGRPRRKVVVRRVR